MPPFQDLFDDGFITTVEEYISSIERDFGFNDNHLVEVDIDGYVKRVLGSFTDDGRSDNDAHSGVYDTILMTSCSIVVRSRMKRMIALCNHAAARPTNSATHLGMCLSQVGTRSSLLRM